MTDYQNISTLSGWVQIRCRPWIFTIFSTTRKEGYQVQQGNFRGVSGIAGYASKCKFSRFASKQANALFRRFESNSIRRENSLTKIDRDVSVTSNVNKILRIRPKLKIRKKSKKYNKIFKIRKYHYWNGTKSTSNRVIRCNSWFPVLGCCSWSRFRELHRIIWANCVSAMMLKLGTGILVGEGKRAYVW